MRWFALTLILTAIIPNLMAQQVFHAADSRGHANHGWLDTHHSFSFASWHNPERMHFGALRVLNDDHVAKGRGFGRHPHDNMEIISIPLSGSLRHEDSMGNATVIEEGEVQIMSAGTGVIHAEFNNSEEEAVKFLQIWIFPDTRDLPPRYDQKRFSPADEHNQWQCIVQPADASGEGVTIHQNAWLHIGQWDAQQTFEYKKQDERNGVYAFVLEGELQLEGQTLLRRDALSLTEPTRLTFETAASSRILLLEVPMQW